jgi:two-component system phosphate regulon sensor histidine kinase PhoR
MTFIRHNWTKFILMIRRKVYLWMGGISLLLLVLISIQFVWLGNAAKAERRETAMHVSRALEHTEQELRNSNYCFEMYTKTYIAPDEAFYIVRQKWDSTGKTGAVDTLNMYFDTEGYYPDSVLYDARTLRDRMPLTADIRLQFTATFPQDTTAFYKERKEFYEKMTGRKLRDIISNKKPVESLFNMNKVDSFLAVSLKQENITGAYGFGFIADKENKISFAKRVEDSAALLHAAYSIHLFTDNKFLKPYRLAVLFKDKPGVYGANLWLMLSIGIVLILMLAFYAFVRLYIRQSRLSEMKSDFINNLTHEFNTPMANISLAIETLEDGGSPPNNKLKRILDIISSESVRLRDNIEQALQVATLEKGNLQLRMEQVDLIAMIHTVLSTYQLQCEQLRGNISFIHPARAVIYGDETHLLNCICNLLDNAIKYRREVPIIEIFVEDRGGQIIISVSDNGQGMANETQKYIFEKFYRENQGNLHNTKGFGLGLSYVRGIVERHGGKIFVWSRKGSGTKFTIQLPKSEQHEAN